MKGTVILLIGLLLVQGFCHEEEHKDETLKEHSGESEEGKISEDPVKGPNPGSDVGVPPPNPQHNEDEPKPSMPSSKGLGSKPITQATAAGDAKSLGDGFLDVLLGGNVGDLTSDFLSGLGQEPKKSLRDGALDGIISDGTKNSGGSSHPHVSSHDAVFSQLVRNEYEQSRARIYNHERNYQENSLSKSRSHQTDHLKSVDLNTENSINKQIMSELLQLLISVKHILNLNANAGHPAKDIVHGQTEDSQSKPADLENGGNVEGNDGIRLGNITEDVRKSTNGLLGVSGVEESIDSEKVNGVTQDVGILTDGVSEAVDDVGLGKVTDGLLVKDGIDLGKVSEVTHDVGKLTQVVLGGVSELTDGVLGVVDDIGLGKVTDGLLGKGGIDLGKVTEVTHDVSKLTHGVLGGVGELTEGVSGAVDDIELGKVTDGLLGKDGIDLGKVTEVTHDVSKLANGVLGGVSKLTDGVSGVVDDTGLGKVTDGLLGKDGTDLGKVTEVTHDVSKLTHGVLGGVGELTEGVSGAVDDIELGKVTDGLLGKDGIDLGKVTEVTHDVSKLANGVLGGVSKLTDGVSGVVDDTGLGKVTDGLLGKDGTDLGKVTEVTHDVSKLTHGVLGGVGELTEGVSGAVDDIELGKVTDGLLGKDGIDLGKVSEVTHGVGKLIHGVLGGVSKLTDGVSGVVDDTGLGKVTDGLLGKDGTDLGKVTEVTHDVSKLTHGVLGGVGELTEGVSGAVDDIELGKVTDGLLGKDGIDLGKVSEVTHGVGKLIHGVLGGVSKLTDGVSGVVADTGLGKVTDGLLGKDGTDLGKVTEVTHDVSKVTHGVLGGVGELTDGVSGVVDDIGLGKVTDGLLGKDGTDLGKVTEVTHDVSKVTHGVLGGVGELTDGVSGVVDDIGLGKVTDGLLGKDGTDLGKVTEVTHDVSKVTHGVLEGVSELTDGVSGLVDDIGLGKVTDGLLGKDGIDLGKVSEVTHDVGKLTHGVLEGVSELTDEVSGVVDSIDTGKVTEVTHDVGKLTHGVLGGVSELTHGVLEGVSELTDGVSGVVDDIGLGKVTDGLLAKDGIDLGKGVMLYKV